MGVDGKDFGSGFDISLDPPGGSMSMVCRFWHRHSEHTWPFCFICNSVPKV